MQVYNPATGQEADVSPEAYQGAWASLGWLPIEARPLVEKGKNPTDLLAGDTVEVTAEDDGRRDHPSAKAKKDN